VLGHLRAWCRDHELFEAAAYLRRHAPEADPGTGPDVLGWLLPIGVTTMPPLVCPCCSAPVRGRSMGCRHYACGCMVLRVPDRTASEGGWIAVMPCQQPGFELLLEAVAMLPDNPLNASRRRTLLALLHKGAWI